MADTMQSNVKMFDIRSDKTEASLLGMMKQALNDEPKSMPTLLLYNEKGLKLFEKITYLDEYYLTNAEIETLTKHADAIVEHIPAGARLIELGSGNLRKVNILLQALERAQKDIDYFALDLSLPELQRTFAELNTSDYKYVKFNAFHGTYDDGLEWLGRPENRGRTNCIMSLGSSLGNFSRDGAAQFLASYKSKLGPTDRLIIALDACPEPKRVWSAYNDSYGVTEQFYRNGLDHANSIFGYEAFKQDQWEVKGEYLETEHAHHASYVAKQDVQTKDFAVKKGEQLPFEQADKYSPEESDRLWHSAGLIPKATFSNARGDYNVHVLTPSVINFPGEPSEYAASPVPSKDEWQSLWAAWDTVTRSMVPREELLEKPIKLRNNLIFYLGHIPTFADIHFTRATSDKPTDPASYYKIFERGIDPDVDDPTVCHAHSEIPDEWPALDDILGYQLRVRNRIIASIDSGRAQQNRKLGRGLWLAYEHEAMHLETFLYMLLYSDKVISPPGVDKPNFEQLAVEAEQKRTKNAWHKIPAAKVRIGIDDPEGVEEPERFFAWDNERPAREVDVHTFEAQSRPISNGDYAHYLEATRQTKLPACWIDLSKKQSNGTNGRTDSVKTELNGANGHAKSIEALSAAFLDGKAVRTVYGPISLRLTLDWPIMASYDELAAYAKWSEGRIPTHEELRSIYHYVETKVEPEQIPSSLVPAVNGHLSNDGVEETPPSHDDQHRTNGAAHANGTQPSTSIAPEQTFISLSHQPIGFRKWHPQPITSSSSLRGQADAGGLWEWTSTTLAAHDGFTPMELYPGYTADFFDDKHNICLGGSWATVPRIAGRRSFVNWYQRNYPFVWCTARMVRDV